MISDLQKIAQSDHLSAFKADRRKKIARLLAEKVKKLLKMNITIEELMEKAPFPLQPFSRPEAKRMFALVRANDADGVKKILNRCKYYVYEYDQVLAADQFKQTALHWAAKRGLCEIAEHLVEFGADLDAKDDTGKTPLYHAVRANCFPIVKVSAVDCS